MNKATILSIIAIVGIAIVIPAIWAVTTNIGLDNQSARLINKSEAQKENLKVVYDKVWKVISQKAQVTDKYAGDFKGIYTEIMDSRYEKGDGTLMKWIHERNPNFDASLYASLSNSIEGLRSEFAMEQKKLLSVKEQHDNLRTTWPGTWFVSADPIEVEVITSGKTKQVFVTGEENDVDVFGSER